MNCRQAICSAALVAAAPLAYADVTPYSYRIGAVTIFETEFDIVLHAAPPVTVAILPGGKTWPRLTLDDTGQMYAGNVLIAAATGRAATHAAATLVLPYGVAIRAKDRGFQFQRGGKTCQLSLRQLGLPQDRTAQESLKNADVTFASAPGALVALTSQFGADDSTTYRVQQVDIGRCQVVAPTQLGNPDLLVELGYSRQGGWWITGSIEQKLLQSVDGRHWRKATLPAGLSSLISSYVANPHEIWLAGILPSDDAPGPHLLAYSGDGGRSWCNVLAGDPLLDRVPPGWLEGQRRRVQP